MNENKMSTKQHKVCCMQKVSSSSIIALKKYTKTGLMEQVKDGRLNPLNSRGHNADISNPEMLLRGHTELGIK